ncbi:MAG: class I SAM-dependent methyltransferase [Verrucomicrobia bacterium]|nr:class I SAM-dependent methyltransferase [Verrucomicrobiota bacterium]NBU09756.1 class I SAM-dependent methyltransferase [Pseudomonadota bacterium]NDA68198.1 class I SAM-dependent methyltransferase [Verrucomicrobiota bacterium]NDB76973.1 class I SAM-dependent methyltransferase [Verrucomicrobiota bacterium]NDD38822.1 class I SAM-dependent methyltransferase [Verrucomicrobiota bacterium]
MPAWNSLHLQGNLAYLEREKAEIETFDLYLYHTLNAPHLRGQIVFEYGGLANYVKDWSGLTVLDIGSGRSSLPRWLAAKGAQVTAFEYPDQVERPPEGLFDRINRLVQRRSPELAVAFGNMLDLPMPDNSFDVVTSFSVIEHLDTNLPDLRYVPYPEQKRRAVRTLQEMARVTKPGGLVYLTSECCRFEKAQVDSWERAYYYKAGPDRDLKEPRFSSAWPVDEIPEIFHRTLESAGCRLVGANGLIPSMLDGRPEAASFRGPHFSGFALLARKEG